MVHTPRRLARAALVGIVTVAPSSVLLAHDTWLLPDLFAVAQGRPVELSARAGGGKFPDGSAVPLDRVASVRVIGATSDNVATDVVASAGALRITAKPTSDGQYLVVLATKPSTLANTSAGFLKFLAAEGASAEARRLAESSLTRDADSVIFEHAVLASTVAEVGHGGARAFSRAGILPLGIVPLIDPAVLRVGDTLRLQLRADGRPVPRLGVDVKTALDTAVRGTGEYASMIADSAGVVAIPLSRAGAWMLRTAWVAPTQSAGARVIRTRVWRATFVWSVRPRR